MEKNLPRPKYKETLKMKIATWAYNSHYWIEDSRGGYWNCKWCGANWTSVMPITEDYNYICKGNPLIKNLIKNYGAKK